jgi:phosphoglycolate phosphatase
MIAAIGEVMNGPPAAPLPRNACQFQSHAGTSAAMPFPFDIIGFDLDGTLLDTSGDLADALNHALTLVERPPLGIDAVRTMIGAGTHALLARGLEATGGCTDDLLERAYPALLRHYAAHIANHSRAYPGLTAALDQLAAAQVTLAVVTNKPEALARTLLEATGMASRFACLIGGDSLGPGNAKPSPAPIRAMIERCGGGRAAFVGDSPLDIAAARGAGIPVLAARFGFHPAPAETLGADGVLDHYDSLVSALRAIAAR